MFFTIVPENSVKILQRFGKYHKILKPGLRVFIPFVDQIEHHLSLKEDAIHINNQSAHTSDNVELSIDGVLFYKILDPFKSAYEIDNYSRGMPNSLRNFSIFLLFPLCLYFFGFGV